MTQKPLSENGRATAYASGMALTLVTLKLLAGIGSGAMVLLASAVDSALDFLVSVFNHFAVRSVERPSDRQYNYGRGKVEGLASFVEGLVIGVSSGVIIYSAVLKILRGQEMTHPDAAIAVMIISTLLTGGLVFHLRKVSRETGSLIIQADCVHYQMDLFTNLGILLALVLIRQTGWYWLDPLFSIGIALYIFYTAWQLIRTGSDMLLDKALQPDLIQKIENVLTEMSPEIVSYHQLRTRKSANVHFVDVDLVFDKDISLMEAHNISERVEEKIKALEEGAWIITCHLDPIDDSQEDGANG